MNNLDDYHDLYVRSVFENFRNKGIETNKLDSAYFLSAPRLTWQACFKKTEVELVLLTDPNMLLMIEEGIRGNVSKAACRWL